MPVRRRPARVFEVREERLVPPDRLPAELVSLHHFYAFVPDGKEDYFLIKLSTTEHDFLDYRRVFRHFIKSFRIIGIR